MYSGATTRAKALNLSDKDRDSNMAEISRNENNAFKDTSPITKTPVKAKDKGEKRDSSSKNNKEKEREKAKTVKAKMLKTKATKTGANASQPGMENFLHSKGFVAEMVDHINSTPPNSPPNSANGSQNKQKMLSIKNGQLAIEEDDTDQCTPSDHGHAHRNEHDNSTLESEEEEEQESHNLASILHDLNTSVKRLEKSVRKMGVDYTKMDHQLSSVESIQTQDAVRIRGIVESLDDQQDKIDLLIGIVEKQDVQIQALQNRWDTAYAKENKSNIVINGLAETQGESCYHEVGNFFKNVLKIEKPIQVQQAYRLGKGQNKAMVAKLKNTQDRAEIYKKIGNLKQANKGRSKPYFVADQLPEAWAEKKKQVHFFKQQNKKLPLAQQANITMDKGIMSLDGQQYKPPLKVPSPKELCSFSPERRKMLRELKIVEGTTETAEESKFTGFAYEIFSTQQVQNVYDALKTRIPDATHIACAFLLPGTEVAKTQGSLDDGEFGAGRCLLNVLLKNNARNRAVFVTRHYGGRHIGVRRFQLMETVTESELATLNQEIQKRKQPLTNEELRQLNEEIRRQAEQKQLQEQEKRNDPWLNDSFNNNQQEQWGDSSTPS